jgi:DNA-binding transcriptional regulator YiaG
MANYKISNSKLNLSIDFILFIVLMAVAGIGMLIKFVLVPGFKRNLIYGQDTELYFLGLDRHQWGTTHLFLSILLIVLLIFHIVLHWKQINTILKKMVTKKTGRTVTCIISIFILAIFGVLPFFVQPTVVHGVAHDGYFKAQPQKDNNLKQENTLHHENSSDIIKKEIITQNKKEYRQHKENQNIDIKGSITLNEVAKKYNVSANELAIYIHVPEEYVNERLGRLRKRYDFHLNDLREYIKSKTKNND